MHLSGFDNFDITKLFYYYLTTNKIQGTLNNKISTSVKLLSLLIYRIFISHINIKEKAPQQKDCKILFIESKSYRKDIKEMISNVQQSINRNLYDILTLDVNKIFSFKRTFSNFIKSIIWFKQTSSLKEYSLNEKLSFIRILMDFKDIEHSMQKIIYKKQYNLCIFFYDAETYQNFLSQYLQHKGIKTATLQHGIMLAPRLEVKNNIDFAGIEFKSFVSNYFLAWNKFTQNEAIKAGIPENKIKILGIAKCINRPPIQTSFLQKKIGIILDGKFEEENNRPMIKIVNQFAKKNGYTYILRYHPNFIGNEYDNFVDFTIGKNCSKNISLEKFLNQISFCIVANSTVLFELEYYKIPFLRYTTNNIKDKFKDYPSMTFKNIEELECKVKQMVNHINYNSEHNNNIQLNYKSFLESFLKI